MTCTLLYTIMLFFVISVSKRFARRSQWLRGQRRRSAAARLLIMWVRIPPGTWTFVYCECCVLSGTGVCDELITRPRGVLATMARRCVRSENLENEEAMAHWGRCAIINKYSCKDCIRLTIKSSEKIRQLNPRIN
jgi:hypothetical protein